MKKWKAKQAWIETAILLVILAGVLIMNNSTGISRITPMHCNPMESVRRPLARTEQPTANSTAPRTRSGSTINSASK